MENRIWKIIGFWTMGLLLFIETMIIIRWVIEFVTWSTVDSGWAQAIGSIAALGVAIYVMSRQNSHAAQLIVAADKLAARRRAAAVRAIVRRAVAVAEHIRTIVDIPVGTSVAPGEYSGKLEAAKISLQGVLTTVKAVPAHELGSFDMAEGIHLLGVNLQSLDNILSKLIVNLGDRGTPQATEVFRVCFDFIENASTQFDRGAAEFD
jgi:hypothetical protein